MRTTTKTVLALVLGTIVTTPVQMVVQWAIGQTIDDPRLRDQVSAIAWVLSFVAIAVIAILFVVRRTEPDRIRETASDPSLPANSLARLSDRQRRLIEWDESCARDWWARDGLVIELVGVRCALEEVNESYALMNVRLWNGLSDSYQVHDLRSANVFVELTGNGEKMRLALREPVRFDRIEVWHGQRATLMLRVPMADNVQSHLHFADADRLSVTWVIEGNWQISAYGHEPMALSRRLVLESPILTSP